MKKIINILSIASSVVACIVIICTFLTSYRFVYVGEIFDSYLPVQVVVAVTMVICAIRFWISEIGRRKIFYTLLSLGISVSLVCFIFGTIR